MIENVIKKDSRIEPFSEDKISNGLFKAVKAAGGSDREKSDNIARKVIDNLNEKFGTLDTIKSDTILDEVETALIKGGHDKVSRAFILYRYRDKMFRKPEDTEKDNILIKEYISKDAWDVKENSNMGYSLQGLNFNLSSKVTQNYWLTSAYPTEI
ncbi:MAG TPA: ATP cone domain-containing protein, partial [Candidatus Paceibacterota bacterium]|nr:ATP cone domain-containing protein [Candidatus Paceibacterota bacterium]